MLSRYLDAIVIRPARTRPSPSWPRAAEVPVINALTPLHHPCQALADLLTLRERFGELQGLRLAYVGDGNNVARSLAIACELAGVELAVAAPDGYQLEEGHGVKLTRRPARRRSPAPTRSTPTSGSAWATRRRPSAAAPTLTPYRVDADLLAAAKDDAVVLHCLPAHPGEEITAEVLYGERSAVWDQAENRLHAQKALLLHAARRVAMYPEIDLGPLTLQTFGLMFAFAFLAAGWLIVEAAGGDRQAAPTGPTRWASRR